MAGRQPEERVARPVSSQLWTSLTFLHWPFDPDVIQARLPAGFTVDTWDGSAWVGMTPFLMTIRIGRLPPLPGMATFPETNLRTYVRGPDGRDGIWFFSLEADSLPLVVSASSLYRVPYKWADMRVDQGDTIRYRSRRRGNRAVGHDITVRVGPPLDSPFDDWLSGRWRAWTRIAGRFCTVPVEHDPWPLHEATVVGLHETLLAASGLTRPDVRPRARFSPGTEVRLGRPHPLRAHVFRTAFSGLWATGRPLPTRADHIRGGAPHGPAGHRQNPAGRPCGPAPPNHADHRGQGDQGDRGP